MVIASLTWLLLTTKPAPVLVLSPYRASAPAVERVSLRAAVGSAARQSASRLVRVAVLKTGGDSYRLPPKTGMRIAGVIMGVAAGFVAGAAIGPIVSQGDCQSPPWLVVSSTAASGVIGGWLVGR